MRTVGWRLNLASVVLKDKTPADFWISEVRRMTKDGATGIARRYALFFFVALLSGFKKEQNDIALDPGLRHLWAGSEYPCGLAPLPKTKTQTA